MSINRAIRSAKRNQLLFSAIEFPNNGKLLDLSCGEGTFLNLVHSSYPNIQLNGVDISSNVIAEAQRTYPYINFQQSDANSIPFLNNSLDIITCSMTLHHYENFNAVISEIFRVLKDDGILYVMDIFPKNHISRSIYNLIGCHEPYHFEKFYLEEEASSIIEKSRFTLIQSMKGTILPRTNVHKFQKKNSPK